MAVDEAFLLGLGSHRDPEGRYRERFLTPIIGGARTVAVLTEPLGSVRGVGWVICHSLAMEQMHLAHLEAQAAHALAAAGFPVLRYHGQGYGDSEAPGDGGSLASHLADAKGALSVLKEQAGLDRIGVIGARFGGTVAALTADNERLPFLVLWDPAVRGARLARDRELASAVSGMLARAATNGDGTVARGAADEIESIDLVRDLRGFDGSALVVGLSSGGVVSSDQADLADRLRSLGAEVAVHAIADPFAQEFGQFHLRTFAGKKGKADVRAELDHALVEATVRWCRERSETSSP